MRKRHDDSKIAAMIADGNVTDGHVYMSSGRPRKLLLTLLTFIVGIAIVIVMWQLMAWYCNEYMDVVLEFPYPSDSLDWVWKALTYENKIYGHSIYEHIIASLSRVLIAFVLAAVIGVTIGSILGYFTSIYPIGIVPVTVFQSIPGLAWVPIALLLFGLGDDASIFIIFAVASVVITMNVAGGVRTIPEVTIRTAKMMGTDGIVMFFKIIIPYSAVSIINSFRLGLGSAWRVLIASEMLIGTGIGLGSSMEVLRDNLDFVGAFGCIVFIVIIGLLIDKVIFTALEKSVRHKLGMEEGY